MHQNCINITINAWKQIYEYITSLVVDDLTSSIHLSRCFILYPPTTCINSLFQSSSPSNSPCFQGNRQCSQGAWENSARAESIAVPAFWDRNPWLKGLHKSIPIHQSGCIWAKKKRGWRWDWHQSTLRTRMFIESKTLHVLTLRE